MPSATDDHWLHSAMLDINDLDKSTFGGVAEMKVWLVQQGMEERKW